jgi:hypothetical protein
MDFPQEGGCLCGAVRFALAATPRQVGWCHCASCRKHTGAPAACFVDCAAADVTFTQGAPAFFASSPGVRRGFCAACGSTLCYRSEAKAEEVSLHVGAFDNPSLFAPNGPPTFAEEKVFWLHV